VEFISCFGEGSKKHVEESSAVISWIKHDPETRRREFEDLFLSVINLNSVSVKFVENVLLKERLIRDNPACYEKVLSAFSELLRSKRFLLDGISQSKLTNVGGSNTRGKVFDVFNGQGQALLTYPDLPIDVNSHYCLKLNDFVYSIGGKTFLFDEVLDSVWQIDIKKQHSDWREIAPINERRYDMGATIHQNCLFIAGGRSDGVLKSVEYYDPNAALRKWKSISPLLQRRSGHALIACEGSLFAIGGQNGREVFSLVERLQDLDGTWQEVAPMQTPRNSFAAVCYLGSIYVIGGQSLDNSLSALSSVEKYDVVADSWSFVKEIGTPRFGHSACILNEKIYVLGGRNKSSIAVMRIECYSCEDPLDDSWRIAGWIGDSLVGHSIVVV